MTARVLAAVLVWTGASVLGLGPGIGGPAPLAAWQAADAAPSGGAPSDTVPAAESPRERIRQRLEALGRPPGADPERLARDSAELARRTGRSEADGPGAGGGGGGGVGAQDSLAQALRTLEGYVITNYSGTSAEFEAADRRLTLRGEEEERPQVSREGMRLAADSAIVYSENDQRVRSVGAAEYTPDAGDAVESRTMVLDLGTERGSALGARTRYAQGGTEWFVSGDLPSVASEIVYGSHTSFTSCELEVPHYHFEAGQVKIHQGNILVARPVRLYFADVPVAWLPFIAQSLAQGRASGLLAPRFSVNDIVRTSSGYSRRISNLGFYWAMSDYTDATLSLDWFSDQFTAVNGVFRYRWSRQFLNGGLNVKRYWRANGGEELTFNTRHNWDISERTRFSMDARYSTSSSFVRQNSFDPREVTQTIGSQGGLSHRFDWGSLNAGADRQQFLSDDRVEMTLPNVSLSLNPITFFQASGPDPGFFRNITWNGRGSVRRNVRDFADQPLDSTFSLAQVDRVDTQASASSSWSLGSFSFSQGGSYDAVTQQGIPDFVLNPGPGVSSSAATAAARTSAGLPALESPGAQTVDLNREELSWNAGASYQQRLIGSTTITPRVQVSSRAVRSDTSSVSREFIAAPMRTSFGARLKTDVYGFWPGAGSFERIRHKLSPGFSYDYSPEVRPTDLQRLVFGSGEIQTRSVVSLTLNQTLEAKRTPEAEQEAMEEQRRADSLALALAREDSVLERETGEDAVGVELDDLAPGDESVDGRRGGLPDEGLERVETGQAVTLLALQTSAVTYDFVQADSAGEFLGGFRTTSLNNSLRSDYLRGMSVQFSHDLFEQEALGEGPARPGAGRRFAPHLSSVNFSFALDSESGLFRWLGLGGGDEGGGGAGAGAGQPPSGRQGPDEDFGASDESSIVPGQEDDPNAARRSAGIGQWNARFSYALTRPRSGFARGSQMINMSFDFQPTAYWDVNWRTSYDVNEGAFNDHMIRLTRDLHRWRANFDFLQTATGNWSFRFSVSLLDNQDLEFDYEQRSPLAR